MYLDYSTIKACPSTSFVMIGAYSVFQLKNLNYYGYSATNIMGNTNIYIDLSSFIHDRHHYALSCQTGAIDTEDAKAQLPPISDRTCFNLRNGVCLIFNLP